MSKEYKIIRAEKLDFVEANSDHPANTYFHLPIASYYNPKNINFGPMRVLNDDEIAPFDGFDRHPHINVEIMSYVIEGELFTKNSSTRKKVELEKGDVQTVSAGTGVYHSEMNQTDDPTRVLQIWFHPEQENKKTRCDYKKFNAKDRTNKLHHIVGNPSNKRNVPLYLEQDINVFVSELTHKKASVSFALKPGRQAYITNMEGSVTIKGFETLDMRDSMTIVGPAKLEFVAETNNAHFAIVEMFKPRR